MTKFFIPLAVFILLTACGGGGGGGGGDGGGVDTEGYTVRIRQTPPSRNDFTPTPAVRDFTNDDEFTSQVGLALIGAENAYARGATGRGIIVGVLDTFLETHHTEFQNMSKNVLNYRRIEVTTQNGERFFIPVGERDTDELHRLLPSELESFGGLSDDFHGTVTAGVLAARRGDRGGSFRPPNNRLQTEAVNMHGIAYESSLMFRSYFFTGRGPRFVSSPDGLVQREDGSSVRAQDLPTPLNSTEKLSDIVMAQSFRDFIQGGARAVNISVVLLPEMSGAGLTAAQISRRIPNTLRALREGRDRTIFVFAAGNQSCAYSPDAPGRCPGASSVNPFFTAENPQADAALPYYFSELRGHVVAVVSVDSRNGVISDFSNRCGIAADWCIAAPGGQITAPWYIGPDISDPPNTCPDFDRNSVPNFTPRECDREDWYVDNFQGTSFAAPMVAGGLALIMGFFGPDRYSIEEFLNRIYTTANKSGIYELRSTYGQGLLDLNAATRPWGATRSLTGTRIATARSFSLSESRIQLGAAMGDSLTRALAGKKSVFFDELDFAFEINAAYYAVADAREHSLDRLARLGRAQGQSILQKQTQNFSLFTGLNKTAFAPQASPLPLPLPEHGFFALAENAFHGGMQMSFGMHQFSSLFFVSMPDEEDDIDSDDSSNETYGLGLAYHFQPPHAALTMEAGLVQESDALLTGEFGGPFALASGSQTFFIGLGGEMDLPNSWVGLAHAALGWTQASNAPHGGLSHLTDILSSSWMIGAYQQNVFAKKDMLTLTLSQRLRVEQGEANIHYALSRTRERALISQTLRSPLTPSGREIRLETKYQHGFLTFSTGYTFQPGHAQNAKGEAFVMARISFPLR